LTSQELRQEQSLKLYFCDQVCEEQENLAKLSGVSSFSTPIFVPSYEQEEEEFLQKRKKPKKVVKEKKKKIVAPKELSSIQRKLLANIIQGYRGSREKIVQEFFLKNNNTTKTTTTVLLPPTKKAVRDAIVEMGVREKREKYLGGKTGWFLLDKFQEEYEIAKLEEDPAPAPAVPSKKTKSPERKKDPMKIVGNLTKFLSTSATPILPPPLPASSSSASGEKKKGSFVLKKKTKKKTPKKSTPKKRASPCTDVEKTHTKKKRKLPDGWSVELKNRGNAGGKQGTYKVYISPNGQKFRSLAAALRSLEPKITIPPPATKITFQDKNPKKADSKSAVRYDTYKKAKTLEEFYSLGGTKADIRNDLRRGYLKIEGITNTEENTDVVVDLTEQGKMDIDNDEKNKVDDDVVLDVADTVTSEKMVAETTPEENIAETTPEEEDTKMDISE
jgi:hypothetical protein